MPTLTRVTRCLRPGQAGTKRLQLAYGSRLVCVRYRESEDGRTRFTTVEIEVDRRPAPRTPVRLVLDWSEAGLRAKLSAAGGRWDAGRRCWVAPLQVVRRLKLLGRIVPPGTDIVNR